MKPSIADVTAAVYAAAAAVEEVRQASSLHVRSKSDTSPVTLADQRSDAILKRALLRCTPAAWLSEESADDDDRLGKRYVWVVDPLDGTKEFVEGVPQYAIAVAHVEDGNPVLAVIHNPATHETFAAERGSGAWLGSRRLQCSDDGPILCSRSELRSGEFDPFVTRGFRLEAIGSIAYKMALVAAGRGCATLSRGPKWEWDVCAGALLVAEAGGVVTNALGAALRFNQRFPKARGIVAGAPAAHAQAIESVRAIGVSERMSEFDRIDHA